MGRRLTDEEREWRQWKEKDYQAKVMKFARDHGWMVAHFHDSRKMVRRGNKYIPVADGDAAGFPDLLLARGTDLLFWEVKTELGKTKPKQDEWLLTLREGGHEARVVRPSDFDSYVQPRLE